jgi:hypothetical protein
MVKGTKSLIASALTVIAAIAVGATSAQEPTTAGEWVAHWASAKGVAQEAHVTITGANGTWKALTTRNVSPGLMGKCETMIQPIAVRQEHGHATLRIVRSQSMAGCTDTKIVLDEVTDTTMRGHFGKGTEVRFTRR